jgi:hypothetical protein
MLFKHSVIALAMLITTSSISMVNATSGSSNDTKKPIIPSLDQDAKIAELKRLVNDTSFEEIAPIADSMKRFVPYAKTYALVSRALQLLIQHIEDIEYAENVLKLMSELMLMPAEVLITQLTTLPSIDGKKICSIEDVLRELATKPAFTNQVMNHLISTNQMPFSIVAFLVILTKIVKKFPTALNEITTPHTLRALKSYQILMEDSKNACHKVQNCYDVLTDARQIIAKDLIASLT